MKLKILLTACVVAATVPAAALADPASQSDKANGARVCQGLENANEALFKATYGTNADKSNAMGKCVSAWAQAEHQARHASEAACKAEQADANFAAAHGGKTFAQYYGRGSKGANALQQCIRQKQAAARAAARQATIRAMASCRTERSLGAAAFAAKYGTFGKCVSKLAANKG